MQNYVVYSEAFKIQLVREIELGLLSQSEANRRYKIRGHSTILRWIRKYGNPLMVNKNKSKGSSVFDEKELLLKNEIKELKRELEDARLRNVVLETLVDVADREYGTNLRKKCGAKHVKRLNP